MSNTVLFEVKALCKSYKNKRVVDDVSYSVNTGELVGLLGTNGAGKTTSFRIAVGLVRPDEGHVFLEGDDVTKDPIHIRARKGLGYLAQEPTIFRDLTVYENLVAILEMRGVPKQERTERTEAMLVEIGLVDHVEKHAKNLSGGLRRRLEIARTLLLKPKILLLDEPFAGLDPKVVGDLQELISNLTSRDIGILITDHKVRETLEVTHRAYIMHDGVILRHGDPDSLIKDERVKQVYLGNSFNDQYSQNAAGNGTAAAPELLGTVDGTELHIVRYTDGCLGGDSLTGTGCILLASQESFDPRTGGAVVSELAKSPPNWLRIAGTHRKLMHTLLTSVSQDVQAEIIESPGPLKLSDVLDETPSKVRIVVLDDEAGYDSAKDMFKQQIS